MAETTAKKPSYYGPGRSMTNWDYFGGKGHAWGSLLSLGAWAPATLGITLSKAEAEKENTKSNLKRLQERMRDYRQEMVDQFDQLGIDSATLYDNQGNVDPDKLQAAYVDINKRLKAAGVSVPESDAGNLNKLAKLARGMNDEQRAKFAPQSSIARRINPDANAPTGTASAGENSGAGPAPTGGKPKVADAGPAPTGVATGKVSAPITPRPSEPVADVQTAGSRHNAVGQRASDTGVRVNGAPVQIGDTATRDNLRSGQSASTATDAVRAREALRDARGERRTELDRYLDVQEKRDAAFARSAERIAARNKALDERFAAERQARMDKRYESLALNNDADWKNLAREGSNDMDYSDEKNADARIARDARIKNLQDRFTKMGDRNDKANLFYQYDPNRQKDLAQLQNLFQQGVDAGNLTDKQIAAVEKKLSGWQSGAERRKSQFDAQEEMRQAEHVADLRRQYGMGDSTVFSKEDVLKFHEGQQTGRQKAILEGMGKPGANQAQAWSQLMAAGVDPESTFRQAMGNADTKARYTEELAGIRASGDTDAQKAARQDELRRRYILDQLRTDRGVVAPSTMSVEEATAKPVQDELAALGAARKDLEGAVTDGSVDEARVQRVRGDLQTQGLLQPRGSAASSPESKAAPAPAGESPAETLVRPRTDKRQEVRTAYRAGFAGEALCPRKRR